MSLEHYPVQLLSDDGETIDGVWAFDDEIEDCCLSLQYSGKKIVITEIDYFEAMCRIREELEKENLRPLSYGASRNVFPSGMSRDMGDATLAYRTTLGLQGKMSDLVFIFATGGDVEPVTVSEQKQFHDEWFKSLELSQR